MKNVISNFALIALILLVTGCATIVREGEVGVRDTFGKFSDTHSEPGLKFFLWPALDIAKLPVRTMNLEVKSDLPSREGLTIASDVSILYRIRAESAPKVLAQAGTEYEAEVILPVFRSSIADVTAQFDAKDMHTRKRAEIESAVKQKMTEILEPRGFHVEAVLLKNIRLPEGLSKSIEDRMKAEQESARMVYVLAQEKQEAERKLIEARGIRDSQQTISQGLNPQVLKFKGIEAIRELAKSPNAKLIVTDGKHPLMLSTSENPTGPQKTMLD